MDMNTKYKIIEARFIPQIKLLEKIFSYKIFSTFSDNVLEEEAKELGEQLIKDKDPEYVYEDAIDIGIEYINTMYAAREGLVRQAIVWLWHLLEQQFIFFYRLLPKKPSRGNSSANKKTESKINFNFSCIERKFREYGIDVKKFSCADDIDTLRLAANTIKHGAGKSKGELMKKRRDLFTDTPFWPSGPDIVESLAFSSFVDNMIPSSHYESPHLYLTW